MAGDIEIDEIVARAVHAAWMSGRLSDGWRYGPERDDKTKEHPCLVPYDALPESEKRYDYATARAVMRALRQRGYVVGKVPGGSR